MKYITIKSVTPEIKRMLTKSDIDYLRKCLSGNKELMDNTKLWEKLFEYYSNSGEMPLGIQKARSGDPDEWILNKLEKEKIISSITSEPKIGSYIQLGKDTVSKNKVPLDKGTVCKVTKLTKSQIFCQSPDDEIIVLLKDKFPFKVVK